MDLLSKLKRRASRLRHSALRWQHVAEVRLGLRPSDGIYGADYFGGANKGSASPDSGYSSYDRTSSQANVAALVLWKHLSPRRSLDVGCALGFVVQALRELKVDAYGVDYSHFAVRMAPRNVRSFVSQGDLSAGLPFPDGSFDVVSCFETLEHLPSERIPLAVAELSRLCSRWMCLTIPSFGPNAHGPAGWFEGKVRPERVAHYQELGADYAGPVPLVDLARDQRGEPIEGHLTIASYSWWTRQLAAVGLARRGDLEARVLTDLSRFGLQDAWNLYLLEKGRASAERPPLPPADAIAAQERRWALGSPRG